MPIDLSKFKKNVDASLKRNEEAFVGRYKDELSELAGLSAEQLQEVCPNEDAEKVYANLLSVVKEASRANVSQATLRAQIKALGKDAVQIARLAGGLAALFA